MKTYPLQYLNEGPGYAFARFEGTHRATGGGDFLATVRCPWCDTDFLLDAGSREATCSCGRRFVLTPPAIQIAEPEQVEVPA